MKTLTLFSLLALFVSTAEAQYLPPARGPVYPQVLTVNPAPYNPNLPLYPTPGRTYVEPVPGDPTGGMFWRYPVYPQVPVVVPTHPAGPIEPFWYTLPTGNGQKAPLYNPW